MKRLHCLFLVVFILSLAELSVATDNPIEPQERVVGGQEATDGQFPWHVRLTQYGAVLSEYIIIGWCGGAIIASNWILTAAHCLRRVILPFFVAYIYVEAGSVTANQPRQRTSVTFLDFHIHPDYLYDINRENDIALIHTESFDLNTIYVKRIDLPTYSTTTDKYAGRRAIASGFGFTTSSFFGLPSDKLNWIALEVITKTACQAQYPNPIPSSSICAEDPTPPKGTVCNYDSGGPLTIEESGKPIVIGITSYGNINNGCDGTAQGFQNVAQFVPWIQSTMNAFP